MHETHSEWLHAVFTAYEAKLLRYAGDIVGASLARDVVQDTFLKLCREPRERVEAHVSPWLFTVCRNGALEIKRKVRRLSSLDEQLHLDGAPAPGAALEESQVMNRIQSALSKLPEQQRELVRLKYDGELSYKEMADVTGLTVSNVGFLLHSALAAVRKQLSVEEQRAANDTRGPR